KKCLRGTFLDSGHSQARRACASLIPGWRSIIHMSRLPSKILAAVIASALTGALASAAAATPTGWVPTHTQGLNLAGKLLGAAPSNQRLQVSVVLPLRNSSLINPTIESGATLTPAQVATKFGPTDASVNAVESYLTSQGFTNLSVSGNKLLVTGS